MGRLKRVAPQEDSASSSGIRSVEVTRSSWTPTGRPSSSVVTKLLSSANGQMFGVVATFSSDAVREIIAERDLEVLLIESGEEFKCNLDDTRLERGYDLRR